MAVKTFYCKNAVPTGATLHRSLQDGGTVTAATTTTGWNNGSNSVATLTSCIQNGGTEVPRADAKWGTTLQPSAAPSQTLGDCWRTENTLTGTFAATAWTFKFGFRSVSTVSNPARFKLAVRVWRSSNANGVGAVECTSGRVVSAATTADLAQGSDSSLTWTWTPAAPFAVSGEYIFVQMGLELTVAGSNVSHDIDFRVDSTSGYGVTTSDLGVGASDPPFGGDQEEDCPQRQLTKRHIAAAFIGANLLATTLAPVPQPFNNDTDANEGRTPSRIVRPVRAIPQHNLLTSTLAPVAQPAVDVLRAPTYGQQQRRLELRQDTSRGWTPDAVIVTAPVGDRTLTQLPQRRAIVADTSAGFLPALYQLPPGQAAPLATPQRRAVHADTSTTIPPIPPVVVPPFVVQADDNAPPARALGPDTSRGYTPPMPPPIGAQSPGNGPQRRPLAGDTSSGFLPGLYALPPGAATPTIAPQRRALGEDTSSAWTPPVVVPPAPPPGKAALDPAPHRRAINAPWLWRPEGAPSIDYGPTPIGKQSSAMPDRVRWLPADTSGRTPYLLPYSGEVPAVNGYLHQPAPYLPRHVTDTSAGMPHALRLMPLPAGTSAETLPIERRPWTGLQLPWQKLPLLDPSIGAEQPPGRATTAYRPERRVLLPETSLGRVQAVSVPVALPPGQAALFHVERRPRIVTSDTSHGLPLAPPAGTPAPVGAQSLASAPTRPQQPAALDTGTPHALRQPAQPIPSMAAQGAPADARRLALDTSQGAYALTYAPIPLPPGAASFVGAPRRLWLNASTAWESPPVAIQGVAPAPPPPGSKGTVKLGKRTFTVAIDAPELATTDRRTFTIAYDKRFTIKKGKGDA